MKNHSLMLGGCREMGDCGFSHRGLFIEIMDEGRYT